MVLLMIRMEIRDSLCEHLARVGNSFRSRYKERRNHTTEWLRRSVDSVSKQTQPAGKIVIVDNASADDSLIMFFFVTRTIYGCLTRFPIN